MEVNRIFGHINNLLVCGVFLFAGWRMLKGEVDPPVGDPAELGVITLAIVAVLLVLNSWQVTLTIWTELKPEKIGGRERGWSARLWGFAIYGLFVYVVVNVALSAT